MGNWLVSEGGLEPPRPIRALAPQASASAIPPPGPARSPVGPARACLLYTAAELGTQRHPVHAGDLASRARSPGRGVIAAGGAPRSRQLRSGGGSGEDADAAGPDQQADDDQDDAPQQLTTNDGHDAGDHEYHCENPEEC